MTLLKRALVVAMLGIAVPAWAQSDTGLNLPVRPTKNGAPGTGVGDQFGAIPRHPLPKRPYVRKPAGESRLIVKFADWARMRPQVDKAMRSSASVDMTAFDAISNQYNLTFSSVFGPTISESDLKALERRAALNSNKAQPDLAGMVYVDGNAGVLETAANALNKLDIVEWAYFQEKFRPACYPLFGPAPAVAASAMATPKPAYDPPGDEGGTAGEADCGDCIDSIGCGDCFTATPGIPFCENPAGDAGCCDTVGTVRPFCVDPDIGGEWDEVCVAIAHLFCDPGIGADRCASLINGSCFEAHGTAGCVNETCCNTVCALDTFCCENVWDAACVALANANCVNPGGGGPTPDLTALQGYLRRASYENQPGGAPTPLALPAPDFQGFTGEGMWLFDDQYLTDHPGAPVPQRYSGLYGLGRQLLEEYNVNTYNGARGRGIKVAVIEWAYYQGHEDLDVISEPGQTLITIPDVGHPDHATACLGIINAQINGFGMNGIAPDAKAYFFPLTSVEEGPREFAAFTHMIQTLEAGDVCSNSWGGGGNLNTNEGTWTLIRLASDIGITVCIAAGNDCANLDDANDLGDSGGIVVGAATPGRTFGRLTFSNFYQQGTAANGNIVHFSGWGESVPALAGSADVFFPDNNWNRSYCNDFNGTSAACPAAAGVVACLQGLAKQFYGIPLKPEQIRSAIAGTGFPQMGMPNPDDLPGFPDEVPCGPDTDFDSGPNKIGPYPRPERAGYFILNQSSVGFDGAPLVDDVTVIRGNKLFGNKFSIKGSDDNYLVVDSLYTLRKFRPNLARPASLVTYLGTGEIADIMVTGHTDAIGNSVQINYEYSSPGGVSFLTTEIFDFSAKKWVTLSFEICPLPGDDINGVQLATAAQRFIDQANGNRMYVRQYVLGLGGPVVPGASTTLTMRWDLINLTVGNGSVGGETP